jgi:2-dehydro-3-deoxygluconokinase
MQTDKPPGNVPRTLDILCLGEPMIEFNQIDGVSFRRGFGGDASNFAIAAARQGARVGMFSALGDDAFGRQFLELWRAESIDVSDVMIDNSGYTAAYVVTHDESGHHFDYLRRGSAASLMDASRLKPARIARAQALHVTGISQGISRSSNALVLAAMEAMRASGGLVTFDTNLRLQLWSLDEARAAIFSALKLCDIARPGHDDARRLLGLDDPDAIVDRFLSFGCKIVVMTLGSHGAIVASREERRRVPAPTVEAIDATGAGDCFGGAFVAEYLRGNDMLTATAYACAAAALKTQKYGAIDGIPTRSEVERFMASR